MTSSQDSLHHIFNTTTPNEETLDIATSLLSNLKLSIEWLTNINLTVLFSRLPDKLDVLFFSYPTASHLTRHSVTESLISSILHLLEEHSDLTEPAASFILSLAFSRGHSQSVLTILQSSDNFSLLLSSLFTHATSSQASSLLHLLIKNFPMSSLKNLPLNSISHLPNLIFRLHPTLPSIPKLVHFLLSSLVQPNMFDLSLVNAISSGLSSSFSSFFLSSSAECRLLSHSMFCFLLLLFKAHEVSISISKDILSIVNVSLSIGDDCDRHQSMMVMGLLSELNSNDEGYSNFDFDFYLNEDVMNVFLNIFKYFDFNPKFLQRENEDDVTQSPYDSIKVEIDSDSDEEEPIKFDSDYNDLPQEIGERTATVRECLKLLQSSNFNEWSLGFKAIGPKIEQFADFFKNNHYFCENVAKSLLFLENSFSEDHFHHQVSDCIKNLLVAAPSSVHYLVDHGLQTDVTTAKQLSVIAGMTSAVDQLSNQESVRPTVSESSSSYLKSINSDCGIPAKSQDIIRQRLLKKTRVLSKGYQKSTAFHSKFYQNFNVFFWPVFNHFCTQMNQMSQSLSSFDSASSVHFSCILSSLLVILGLFVLLYLLLLKLYLFLKMCWNSPCILLNFKIVPNFYDKDCFVVFRCFWEAFQKMNIYFKYLKVLKIWYNVESF
ncbi:hypothetical protein GEMRC1_005068 [Eukaryota sp. GEM-RC1]